MVYNNMFNDCAYKYITDIKCSSAYDLQLLRKWFDDKILSLPRFEDIQIDIRTFTWKSDIDDRNWWWQLQFFPFLNYYINSFDLLSEFESRKYLVACLDSIVNWYDSSDVQTPLLWHDHATAFRLRNIINWLVFCKSKKLDIHLQSSISFFYDLLWEHFDWLMDINNYSKYTNHGFDQAMILLVSTSMMTDKKALDIQKVSQERLIDEINFAFTKDGVHKENSPGYQKFMFQRLKQLEIFQYFGLEKIYTYAIDIIEKSKEFLTVITMPNGELPMLGDTLSGVIGIKSPLLDNKIHIYDYSESGYVVAKGMIANKAIFLLFKNMHESNYHRHDDDLSIFLYYDGEVILGDGGLGSHNETLLERVTLRSVCNHCTVVLPDFVPIRDINKLDLKPCIKKIENNIFIGTSYMYGIKVERKIDLTSIERGEIIIQDYISDQKALINFVTEVEAVERIDNNGFSVGGNCIFSIVTQNNEPFLDIETALISKKYGTYEKMKRFGWSVLNSAKYIIRLT